ncbi:MAG: RICIN domain-containing protein [Chroococcus sp. CMT-3BRIN-NPC107]|nr:RICIN domain-containing protein [Chroococcus sp. CMT-3BRIN-NPC107]
MMKLTSKFLFSLLLVFSSFTFLFLLGKKPSVAQSTSDGVVNSLSGKCIDVAGGPGRSNGATLQLWDCERFGRNADNGSMTDQKWQLD